MNPEPEGKQIKNDNQYIYCQHSRYVKPDPSKDDMEEITSTYEFEIPIKCQKEYHPDNREQANHNDQPFQQCIQKLELISHLTNKPGCKFMNFWGRWGIIPVKF